MEGRRAVGGSPLDGGRQVCPGMAEVVVAPTGCLSSPAVEGLEVAPVVEVAASRRVRGVVENLPSVVVPSVGLEIVVTVGEVGRSPSVGLSENCSRPPTAPPTLVLEGVVMTVVVDLPPVVAFGGLAEMLPPVTVTVEVVVVVVSSGWLGPCLDVESGGGSVVEVDSVLVLVATG